MRGLDNENNPYADQYQEWDYWAFCTAHEPADDEAQHASAMEFPDDWMRVSVKVDKGGYPIPICSTEKIEWCGRIQALGPVSEDLRNRLCKARLAVDPPRAETEIPDWLGANPPRMVRVMPAGEFVVLGELGSGITCYTSPRAFPEATCDLSFYWFDNQGSLLGKSAPGESWRSLLWPGYEDFCLKVDQDSGQEIMYGNLFYILIFKDPARESVTIGLDGNLVDSDREQELWEMGYQVLCGLELSAIYDEQQVEPADRLSLPERAAIE